MPVYEATTETGAVYCINTDTGFWTYRGANYGRINHFKVVDWDKLMANGNQTPEFWDYLEALPEATAPQEGLSIYLGNIQNWRVSTPIRKVEVTND